MSIKEIADQHTKEVCSFDWCNCMFPEDEVQMARRVSEVIERAIREEAAPLVEALEVAQVGMCAVGVPNPNERAVLREAHAEVVRAVAEWRSKS